ncbi:MAG: serine/threonine protein kinase [Planctomycetes bacterium]|nr:serine/threonine protein kinase [Planctomycetota bacterium]
MRPPPRLGPYTLLRELARGGMGVVHEALHGPTGARHALKTLLPGAEPEELLRLRREAEVLARLDHPHIVRVHAADLEARPPWVALDLLEGGSLQERLAHGPLAPEEVARLGATLARALAHAHARGVLHRDLKPSNVLFDEQGEPRLVDLGLGLAADGGARLTRTGAVLGTPAFMAPEQAEGLKAEDARTDVYGLGATLYAALAGRPPFEGATLAVLQAVLEGAPAPLARLRPGLPPGLVAVVERAMARRPEDRFPSADALAEALERAPAARPRAGRAPAVTHGRVSAAPNTRPLMLRSMLRSLLAAAAPPPAGVPAPAPAPAAVHDPGRALAAAREALRLDDLRGLDAALAQLEGRVPRDLLDEVVARAVDDERLPGSFLLPAALRRGDEAAIAAVKRACAYLGSVKRAAPGLRLVEQPPLRDLFVSLLSLKEAPFEELLQALCELLRGEPALEFALARCGKDVERMLAALELTEEGEGPPGPFTAVLRGEILFVAHNARRERARGDQSLRPRFEREVARGARGEPVAARVRLVLADLLMADVHQPVRPAELEAARRAHESAEALIRAAEEPIDRGEGALLGTFRDEVKERAAALRASIDQASPPGDRPR